MARTLTDTPPSSAGTIPKSLTGIHGLDEITGGGLPTGRPTLVCGGPGCGKTLLGLEFLVRGAMQYDEPGAFIAFEETPEDLTQNVRSLGFDLDQLCDAGRLAVDYIRIERSEIDEAGEYDLEGLFIRLGYAIDSVGAKRVVIDTIESLFSSFSNMAVLRAELRRLFTWLKDRGVTAIVTGERGDGQLTRQGLEEYVSDCVIVLDHRVTEQVTTRRLRVVKYRGTRHETNEFPFLIGEGGLSVVPITSLRLDYEASDERVSTGIPQLDTMLGGQGYFRGSSILISGTAGTGKTSLLSHAVRAACQRGERCMYFSFEESQQHVVRNMKSIGLDLGACLSSGLLRFHANRPTLYGLEMHLAVIHKHVQEFGPQLVVVDPVDCLVNAGNEIEARAMLARVMDLLKSEGITACFSSLTGGGTALEATGVGLSSTVDTWLLLRDIELGGERNRALYVLKSRGMAHSNQIREFLITDRGIELREAYVGPEGVLTGSMRAAQEAREQEQAIKHQQQAARELRERNRRRQHLEAQIQALKVELEEVNSETESLAHEQNMRAELTAEARRVMAESRRAE